MLPDDQKHKDCPDATVKLPFKHFFKKNDNVEVTHVHHAKTSAIILKDKKAQMYFVYSYDLAGKQKNAFVLLEENLKQLRQALLIVGKWSI